MTLSAEEQAYVRRHLGSIGKVRHLVVEDRLLRFGDPIPVMRDSPTISVDAIAARYLAENIGSRVTFDRRPTVPPPFQGTPIEGQHGERVQLPPDTAYLRVFDVTWRRRSDDKLVESIPAVAFYGGRDAVPGHYIDLSEPAPGDVPCVEYCRTAEQAFLAIRGRLRLIIHVIVHGGK